jgi:serine/threonine protein kinase
MACKPLFSERKFGHLDPHAVSFLKQLLARDPEQRPSAKEALYHPWIEQNLKTTPITYTPELLDSAFLSFSSAANFSQQMIVDSPPPDENTNSLRHETDGKEVTPKRDPKTYHKLATPRID